MPGLDDTLVLFDFVIVFFVLALLLSWSERMMGIIRPSLKFIMPLVTAGLVMLYLANAFHYIFFTGLFDHAELSVATAVRMFNHGQPLYHSADSASCYSLMYGPNAYLPSCLALRLMGDPLGAGKVVNAVFTSAGLVLLWITIRRSTTSRFARQAALSFFCGAGLLFWDKLVWLRSDPQLVFWAVLAVWGMTRRNPVLAFAVMGAATGAALNTKVDAVFCFLPMLAFSLQRGQPKLWGIFLAAAGIVVAAPFLLIPGVSFANYVYWVRMATHHGIAQAAVLKLCIMAGFLFLPLILVVINRFDRLGLEERRQFLAKNKLQLALSALGVCALMLLASKNGSGDWHLLPFLPVVAWLLAMVLNKDEAELSAFPLRGLAGGLLAAMLAVAACNGVLCLRAVTSVYSHSRPEPLKLLIADAQNIAKKLPGQTITTGYGGDNNYFHVMAQLGLPVQTNLVLDGVTLMDMHLAGVPIAPATYDALRTGAVPVWLIPKGDVPFSIKEWYFGQDLFGQQFRQIFNEHYRKIGSSAYFDVWQFDH